MSIIVLRNHIRIGLDRLHLLFIIQYLLILLDFYITSKSFFFIITILCIFYLVSYLLLRSNIEIVYTLLVLKRVIKNVVW